MKRRSRIPKKKKKNERHLNDIHIIIRKIIIYTFCNLTYLYCEAPRVARFSENKNVYIRTLSSRNGFKLNTLLGLP